MALGTVLKNLGSGLGEEIRDFRSILGRIRLTVDTSPLGANFRRFGPSFGAYDFDAFVEKAKEFYRTGIDSRDPRHTIVHLHDSRVGIDYNGEVRGIFGKGGRPLAFFRVDYHQAGYRSKTAELEDFRRGKHILFG